MTHSDDGEERVADEPLPLSSRLWAALSSGRWAALGWLSLALAAWVGKEQISSIVAQVTPTGQFSISSMLGFGQLGSLSAPPYTTFRAWIQAGPHFLNLQSWLWWYLVTDGLYILGIAMLGTVILRKYGKNLWSCRSAGAVILAYALELIAGAVALAFHSGSWQPVLAWALHVATIAKWVTVIIALAWLVVRLHASYEDYRETVAASRATRSGREASADGHVSPAGSFADIRRLLLALEVQRFSVVVVLLLGLIAIGPPLIDVFEQMPDVQRAWISGSGSAGLSQLLVAMVAQVLLALMLLCLGRMRERRAERKFRPHAQGGGTGRDRDDGRLDHSYLVWVGLPVVVLALAGALVATGWAAISWKRVIAFSVILLGIAAASGFVQRAKPAATQNGGYQEGQLGRRKPLPEPAVVSMTKWTGEALAVAVIAVMPIGLVRAFTVPALLTGGLAAYAVPALVALSAVPPLLVPWLWPLLCRVAAPAIGPAQHLSELAGRYANALVGRPIRLLSEAARRLLSSAFRREAPQEEAVAAAGESAALLTASAGSQARRQELAPAAALMWVLAVPFIGADIFLIVLPLPTAQALGVLGTAVIGIGSLAVLLGVLGYLAQTRLPLPFFRWIRMNVTPTLSIVLAIAIAGGIADSNSALHQIRPPGGGKVPQRPTLAASLDRWLRDEQASPRCAIAAGTLPGGYQLRIEPLVQVAANGGGIRAAWWTFHALADIARRTCGRTDIFDVSSVSGGSVGAAILASQPGPQIATASRHLAAMAGPDALAAAVDGLMLRDTIAGYTGIDLRAATTPGAPRFPDRAALMTMAWRHQDPSLRRRFLSKTWLNWDLLFNSTSVATGCRAVISTVKLPAATAAAPGGRLCGLGTASPTGSYDFFSRLHCLDGISMATAALLSARYAFITPSATVNSCGSPGTLMDQLVDGGYGEGTGLSTLIDLAPAVMAQVRLANDQAIAGARPGQPVTLVVPVTVYLRNSVQTASAATPASRTPEVEVVSTGKSIGPQIELVGTDTLLQAMLADTGPSQWATCGDASSLCAQAVQAASERVPDQLIYVAPRESPSVVSPLGWMLSQASRDAMNRALGRDFGGKPCGAYPTAQAIGSKMVRRYARRHPYCLPAVGGMADLRALIPVRAAPAS